MLFILIIFIGSLISCGEEEEEEITNGEEPTVTVEDIVGRYELFSFHDKDENFTLIIGSEEAGDLKHTRVINDDNTYFITETESGETYTESGAFSFNDNLIVFEIKESSNPENLNIKNTYAVRLERDELILAMQDSTDELFREDIGDVLTYKKIQE
jgi:hypothetical protein